MIRNIVARSRRVHISIAQAAPRAPDGAGFVPGDAAGHESQALCRAIAFTNDSDVTVGRGRIGSFSCRSGGSPSQRGPGAREVNDLPPT